MRRVLHVCGLALSMVGLMMLGGCGEGGSQPAASGHAASSAAGAAAPVAGKPVSRASQLEGTWFRRGNLSSDGLVGIEFAEGGTITFVVAGRRGVEEATFPFTLLDDGRIRVTHPQFPTESQVAVIKVDGSAMSLEPQTQSQQIGMIEATFDRLSGQSIPQRLEARIAEIYAEREALAKQIGTLIEQPNLVLLPDDMDAARIALDAANQEGRIALQRIGQTVIAREARLAVVAEPDGAPAAALQLGNVVGPPGAGNVPGETIQFKAWYGEDGSMRLTSPGAALRQDASLHASVRRDYEALLAARREIIDAFHDRIGHFLLLQGEQPNPNMAPEQLAFLRVEGEDLYRTASLRANTVLMPTSFNDTATVQLANDEARLNTRTHQVFPDPDGPTGSFIVVSRAGAQRMTALHQMTREALDARQAQCAAIVEGMRSQPLQLVGTYQSSNKGYIRPARFSITCADGKTLGGTFHSDGTRIEGPINGDVQASMLGLVLRVGIPKPSPHDVPGGNFTESGTATLHLDFDEAGVPVLTGQSRPGDSENRFALAPPSPDEVARLRQAFQAHLQAGGRFQWDRTGSTGGGDEVLAITLTADGAEGVDGVRGTAGFRRDGSAPVVGRLSEGDGLLVLDLDVQPGAEASGRGRGSGPMRLYIIPTDETFQLSGYSTWNGQTRTRYVSYAPVPHF